MNSRSLRFLSLGSLPVFLALPAKGWTPGTPDRFSTGGFVVNPQNRIDVLSFYNAVYGASEDFGPGMLWTGNVSTCNAGTTSVEFKNDVLRRVNFYRALVGLPATVTFNSTYNSKTQQMALMMSRNDNISHYPATSWSCYSSDGAQAAASSNLALGNYGPRAIDAYIDDPGSGNQLVGHRRWILYRGAATMGTGDVPPNGSNRSANALWVIGSPTSPLPAAKWVAWPNEGYCPQPLISERFSLSYPGANFANAAVVMSSNNNPVSVNIVSRTDVGYGENTIVWEPSTLVPNATHQITVVGIAGSGVPTSYSYTVNMFDPGDLGAPLSIAGSTTPSPLGSSYSLTLPAGVDATSVSVSRLIATTWPEGAENSTASRIIDETAASYDLRQTSVFRTGSRAFQLTFPSFNDGEQKFGIDRDIMVGSGAKLTFFQRFRSSGSGSRVRAEVSTNGGVSWTEVWGRNGINSGSVGSWDADWNATEADLAPYVGKSIRVRFRYTYSGITYLGTSSNFGVFIDDIAITNSEEISAPVVTGIDGGSTSFTLNATSAGATLTTGHRYILAPRVDVGTVIYPAQSPLIVTIGSLPPGYYQWVASTYPSVTGGPTGDHDNDGIRNVIEYAFGLNPTLSTPSQNLPQPISLPTAYAIQFTKPAAVTNLTYYVDWSPDLVNWSPANNVGSGNNYDFRVPKDAGRSRTFFRHRVEIPPL